jgi:hypothetical protein
MDYGFGTDPTGMSWGLFALSGNPGYYMLYKNILDGEETGADGLTELQRQKR